MTLKYLISATLCAGLVIFIWGAFSHTALPVPEPMKTFKDGQSAVDFVKAQTSGNAVYFEPRGIFMAVRLGDQNPAMGPYLAVEAASNLICGFLLALLLAKARATSLSQYFVFGMIAGLLSWFSTDVSQWNWYGFSPALTLYGLLDVPIGCGLAALAVGWMTRKWFPEVSGLSRATASAAR